MLQLRSEMRLLTPRSDYVYEKCEILFIRVNYCTPDNLISGPL